MKRARIAAVALNVITAPIAQTNLGTVLVDEIKLLTGESTSGVLSETARMIAGWVTAYNSWLTTERSRREQRSS
jgi:hypothetical protein